MAQQVNVKFIDDLDGSDAAGTVSFGLDGKAYEIDLSDDNAAKLRDSLAVFVGAALCAVVAGALALVTLRVSSGPAAAAAVPAPPA